MTRPHTQAVCPPPHHIRRLAEKIRVAKVAKERSLQLQEKAQIRVQQAEYNTAFDTYVKRGRGGGTEGEERRGADAESGGPSGRGDKRGRGLAKARVFRSDAPDHAPYPYPYLL